MEIRQVGAYVSRGRVGLGLAAMIAPGATLTIAFGRGASTPGARAVGRLFGAADAAIGAGGSIAVGQGVGGGDWLSMMALVDAFDGVVMLATPGLPKRARLIGVCAIGSAIAHLYLSRDIAAREHADLQG